MTGASNNHNDSFPFVLSFFGGGGGVTPTYIPQYDRHDMLIILRYISWGNFLSIFFVRAASGLVLRLPLYKGSVTGAHLPNPPLYVVRGPERTTPPPPRKALSANACPLGSALLPLRWRFKLGRSWVEGVYKWKHRPRWPSLTTLGSVPTLRFVKHLTLMGDPTVRFNYR